MDLRDLGLDGLFNKGAGAKAIVFVSFLASFGN